MSICICSNIRTRLFSKKVHSIVEMILYACKDKNPKIIEVEFDASSQVENDVWCLCKNCNQKLEFRKYRIHEKYLVKLN